MAKNAVPANTTRPRGQQSIMSFFGAGAAMKPKPKADNKSEPAKESTKQVVTSEPKKKSMATPEEPKKSRQKVRGTKKSQVTKPPVEPEEEVEHEPEEEERASDSDDVEMVNAPEPKEEQEQEEDAEEPEEEEEEPTRRQSTSSGRRKRRRICRRLEESDDSEFSDDGIDLRGSKFAEEKTLHQTRNKTTLDADADADADAEEEEEEEEDKPTTVEPAAEDDKKHHAVEQLEQENEEEPERNDLKVIDTKKFPTQATTELEQPAAKTLVDNTAGEDEQEATAMELDDQEQQVNEQPEPEQQQQEQRFEESKKEHNKQGVVANEFNTGSSALDATTTKQEKSSTTSLGGASVNHISSFFNKRSPTKHDEPRQHDKPGKLGHASSASTASSSASTKPQHAPLCNELLYATLASVFAAIEDASSRLVIQDLLTQFFIRVIDEYPSDLLASIYLCVCTDLAPPFENLKIGIGDAILIKSIGEATGTSAKFVKEKYQKEGDLGKVAKNSRSKQNTLGSFCQLQQAKPLSVTLVYQSFVKIAKMTGNNSQQAKCSLIKNLLVRCDKAQEEAKYLIRGLQGKLRIGLSEKTILISLAYAFLNDHERSDKTKQQVAHMAVKRAFSECPSYNALVQALYQLQNHKQQQLQQQPKEKQQGAKRQRLDATDFEALKQLCHLTPGTPVSPMLARPTKSYAMVFDRFQTMPFTCEYKYDGERAQIHIRPDGSICIFSRNFENSTERFPDVQQIIAKAAIQSKVTSCIVDAEVVAVDRASNKRLPFQILSTRSRKNVRIQDIKVPVCVYAFDVLYLNETSLLTESLASRRRLLRECFQLDPGNFEFATSIDVDDRVHEEEEAMEEKVDRIRTFLEQAVHENCEGLMVKTLVQEATYEPANRSHKWLKLKKDYLDGIGDSTDLVPIGAFYGRGKRTGVYGAFLLACYDPEAEMFQCITKLGTGLSDEVLKQFYTELKAKVVDKVPRDYAVADGVTPDVWFEPSCVWEILGADLSISPKYTAAMGMVASDKGISLRFPRFIRSRHDKTPIEATTASQIADLYRAQGLATATNGADDDDDDLLL